MQLNIYGTGGVPLLRGCVFDVRGHHLQDIHVHRVRSALYCSRPETLHPGRNTQSYHSKHRVRLQCQARVDKHNVRLRRWRMWNGSVAQPVSHTGASTIACAYAGADTEPDAQPNFDYGEFGRWGSTYAKCSW